MPTTSRRRACRPPPIGPIIDPQTRCRRHCTIRAPDDWHRLARCALRTLRPPPRRLRKAQLAILCLTLRGGWCSRSPVCWTGRKGVELCGEPATEIAGLALAVVTGCEEAGIDGAGDARGDGHPGGDVEAGDVGDLSLVESPARPPRTSPSRPCWPASSVRSARWHGPHGMPRRRSTLALRPSEDSVAVPAFAIVSSASPLDSRARRIRCRTTEGSSGEVTPSNAPVSSGSASRARCPSWSDRSAQAPPRLCWYRIPFGLRSRWFGLWCSRQCRRWCSHGLSAPWAGRPSYMEVRDGLPDHPACPRSERWLSVAHRAFSSSSSWLRTK